MKKLDKVFIISISIMIVGMIIDLMKLIITDELDKLFFILGVISIAEAFVYALYKLITEQD